MYLVLSIKVFFFSFQGCRLIQQDVGVTSSLLFGITGTWNWNLDYFWQLQKPALLHQVLNFNGDMFTT